MSGSRGKPQVPPPGFQLFFSDETTKEELYSNPFYQIILPIHWSVIRTPRPHHFRRIQGPKVLSESLPDNWQKRNVKVECDEDEETRLYIELYYKDVGGTNDVIRVKVVEAAGGDVAVHVRRFGDEDVWGGVLKVDDYLVGGEGSDDASPSVADVYKVGELWELETIVQDIVMGRVQSPYASKLPPKEQKKQGPVIPMCVETFHGGLLRPRRGGRGGNAPPPLPYWCFDPNHNSRGNMYEEMFG